ncbi:hypothetical protein C2U72_00495 [Prosthecomicrobium hirschii]|uniref:hypothetical protein n=1 Tax=Prosthecodimorpha hirschii TaxID=665126 RepID=UPI00112A19C5|nr:hypothetical protein [Prosthecomicrobium hirschii]TPQ52963.1 hypothetical protein C2U72_00495 [Prosthecomicrobium hirschii]
MNALPAPEAGRVEIRVTVAEGRVRAADIRSLRPLSIVSRFTGRTVGEIVPMLALLHGPCGASHAAALRVAGAAAQGRAVPADETAAWVRRLAGERVAEHLGHLAAAEALPDFASDETRRRLRDMLAAARVLARGMGSLDRPAATLLEAAARLDLGDRTAEPTAAPPEPAHPVDPLTGADDPAILAGLAADPDFPARPALEARCPEAGPAARCGDTAAAPGMAIRARRTEIRAALAEIGGTASDPAWIAGGGLGDGAGFAAVESPRGRLHYRVAIAADGRIREARVLAPTEWNFHPQGPVARMLVGLPADHGAVEHGAAEHGAVEHGARGDPARDAERALARRVAAFDPCVPFRIVWEAADA